MCVLFVHSHRIYLLFCRIIDPLREIGRGDLDPLGRGGGGMLFNPPFNSPHQPNILPRGPNNRNPPGVLI